MPSAANSSITWRSESWLANTLNIVRVFSKCCWTPVSARLYAPSCWTARTEAGGLQVAVHHVAEAAVDPRVEASRRLRVELLQARVAVHRIEGVRLNVAEEDAALVLVGVIREGQQVVLGDRALHEQRAAPADLALAAVERSREAREFPIEHRVRPRRRQQASLHARDRHDAVEQTDRQHRPQRRGQRQHALRVRGRSTACRGRRQPATAPVHSSSPG